MADKKKLTGAERAECETLKRKIGELEDQIRTIHKRLGPGGPRMSQRQTNKLKIKAVRAKAKREAFKERIATLEGPNASDQVE